MNKVKTIVVVGPTCTGKTSLAIKLCRQFNGSIVSADSRQVVRHMDIGTGKIPAGEAMQQVKKTDDSWILDGVNIYGYDLVNPDEYFSAYDYKNYCGKLFPRISLDGKNIFLVGGTGFYVDAITGKNVLEGGGPNMKLRQELELLSVDELAEKLLSLDGETYKSIDIRNPARLVRAIEKASQRTSTNHEDKNSNQERLEHEEQRRENNIRKLITPTIYIGLTAGREVLYSRADSWVEQVFNDQLFEEVKNIQKQFPESHRLNGLIYKSALDYLAGNATLEKAKERAKFDIHSYIRRQQTWFKRNQEISWFDITQKNFDAEVSSLVESKLHG